MSEGRRTRRGRILVAEDEEGLRSFLSEALESAGHEVVAAADGEEAIATLRAEPFDVLITDLRMPRADGMAVVRVARTEQSDVEAIILTAHGAVSTAVEAMKLGAFDYLEKPIASPKALRDLVQRALERRDAIVGARTSETSVSTTASSLTFGAPAMKPVVEALDRVARTNATVLLVGESGTGKEVAARHLHERGARAKGPFVAINCAVLSESLLESELFGHEKGAFTGAHTMRKGRLELADGGTFFLDEIGELAPKLQAKLLRVLEERAFERLGGTRTIDVDVRLVAATHRDLRAMVKEGSFREDLYHRLAVFPVRLPPLRERREDVLPLAEALLARLATEAGRKDRPTLDASARKALSEAAFPGNVRELRNALERALILADGPTISAEDLLLEQASTEPRPSEPPRPVTALVELEREAIVEALRSVGGNRREAAAKLGIGLRTLYEKLKRYQIG
ncbi:MAG: sigma-54 dependent transcriptional regulator [Polyangiales bacterium]